MYSWYGDYGPMRHIPKLGFSHQSSFSVTHRPNLITLTLFMKHRDIDSFHCMTAHSKA